MPGDKVLSRHITLPIAAEENLGEVLGFEMDLHTPFTVSQVYYDYTIIGRDNARQTLTVDLVFAPRDAVESLIEQASSLGLQTDVVTCRRRDNSNLQPVNLLPQDKRRARRLDMKNLNLALTALLAVLLVAAITIPIVQKNRVIEEIEAQVQAAAAEAREGSELRQNLENMADASRFLIEKKATQTMIVELIDEVSRLLPDHTWISRLDLADGQLQLQGQSSASASLIATIESSPRFANARFRSPVVQVAGSDKERFHISADIVEVQAQ